MPRCFLKVNTKQIGITYVFMHPYSSAIHDCKSCEHMTQATSRGPRVINAWKHEESGRFSFKCILKSSTCSLRVLNSFQIHGKWIGHCRCYFLGTTPTSQPQPTACNKSQNQRDWSVLLTGWTSDEQKQTQIFIVESSREPINFIRANTFSLVKCASAGMRIL